MKNKYRVNSDGTVTIYLQNELEALIDGASFDLVNSFEGTWFCHKNRRTFYVLKFQNKKVSYLHRILMQPDKGFVVDHINHNGLDNRRENLRITTVQENVFNRRSFKNSSSEFKGVSFISKRGKWEAQICHNYQREKLGVFSNELDAAKAYDVKALELFGSSAFLNFPLQ